MVAGLEATGSRVRCITSKVNAKPEKILQTFIILDVKKRYSSNDIVTTSRLIDRKVNENTNETAGASILRAQREVLIRTSRPKLVNKSSTEGIESVKIVKSGL